MIRTLIALGIVFLLLPGAHAQTDFAPEYGGGVLTWARAQRLPNYAAFFPQRDVTLETVGGERPRGRMTFDSFHLLLSRDTDARVVTKTVAVRVPANVQSGDILRGFTTTVRGVYSKGRDARILISLDAGGVRKTLESPEGERRINVRVNRTYTSTLAETQDDGANYIYLPSEPVVNSRVRYYDVRLTVRIERPEGSAAEGEVTMNTLSFAALVDSADM